METTKAQQRAAMKYMSKNLETVTFRVKKGQKELLRQYAASRGESLQKYIKSQLMNDTGIELL